MSEFETATEMMDIKVIHISGNHIIASGRRFGRYWILKAINSGDSGYSQDSEALGGLRKEFELRSRLLHPGVAHTVALEEIGSLGPCIVVEWVEGKTLLRLLQKGALSKGERRRIMREIIAAVGYMQSRGVVWTGLNLSNIIVRDADGGVVLADYGFSDKDCFVESKGSGDDIYNLGMIMRELCPEYGAIAKRCTGPVEKRPADTTALLKSLERHDRIPKMIMAAAAVVLLAATGFTAAAHIGSLSRSSHDAQERVVSLAAANRIREKQMAELTDSIEAINAGIMEAEKVMERLNSYDEARKRAYLAACGRIDKCLDDFEKNVFSKDNSQEPAYYDSVCELHLRLQDICASSYDRGLLPEFREDDAVAFRDEISGYYLAQFQKKYTAWQAALRKSQVNKRGLPENRDRERKND